MLIRSPCSCLCNGFMGDWDLPETTVDPYVGIEEPDYAKFENVSNSRNHDDSAS